jgi:hypothetical protein
MDPDREGMAGWRDYRARARFFWLAWLGGFLATILVGALFGAIFRSGDAFAVAGVAWIAAFLVAAFRLYGFRCPRCGQLFFCTAWYTNPFARRCLHCRLPKWADPSGPC